MGWQSRWLQATALIALVAAVYGPSLSNGFIYDDKMTIVRSEAPESASEIAEVFGERNTPTSSRPHYRPLAKLSILAQKALHGDRPAGFHAFNLLLIAAAALLAWALLRWPAFGLSPAVAWLGAALFAIHPIASSCVHPISSGRETLMPALFILASVTAFLRRGAGWYAAALAAFACALLSKEQAAIVPALFALADVLGVSAAPPRTIADWVRRYSGVGLVVVAYAGIRAALFQGLGEHRVALTDDPSGPLLSLLYTLQVVFAPFAQLVYEPRVEIWWSPVRLAFAGVIVVGIAGLAVRRWRVLRVRVAFWSGWAILALLPTANLLAQETRFAERYAFVSLLGVIAIALTAATANAERSAWRRAFVAAALAAGVTCAVLSIGRGAFFRDDFTFLTHWIRVDPEAAQPHLSLASWYDERMDFASSVPEYRRALELAPGRFKPTYRLGVALLSRGEPDEAARVLETAIRIDPGAAHAHYMLGRAFATAREPARAAAAFRRALELQPDFPAAERQLAQMLAILGG